MRLALTTDGQEVTGRWWPVFSHQQPTHHPLPLTLTRDADQGVESDVVAIVDRR